MNHYHYQLTILLLNFLWKVDFLNESSKVLNNTNTSSWFLLHFQGLWPYLLSQLKSLASFPKELNIFYHWPALSTISQCRDVTSVGQTPINIQLFVSPWLIIHHHLAHIHRWNEKKRRRNAIYYPSRDFFCHQPPENWFRNWKIYSSFSIYCFQQQSSILG